MMKIILINNQSHDIHKKIRFPLKGLLNSYTAKVNDVIHAITV